MDSESEEGWSVEEVIITDCEQENEDCVSDVSSNTDVKTEEFIVPYELSKEDKADKNDVISMYGNEASGYECEPCCSDACNKRIPKNMALQHRYSFQELTQYEKDIVILSHLQQHRRMPQLTKEYAAQHDRKRSRTKHETLVRQNIPYFFCDLHICRKMYFFLHDMRKDQYKNLLKHFDDNGLVPRIHKNTVAKVKRNNALNPEDIENIVNFIKGFSNQNGHSVPRSTRTSPQFKNYEVIKLPPHVTKRSVYSKYCEIGLKPIARSTFLIIWNKYCPYVCVSKSLCNKQQNNKKTKSTKEPHFDDSLDE